MCGVAGPEGNYYALPSYGVPGFKVGRYHHLGQRGPADEMDRESHPEDEEVLREGIHRYFPDANGPTLSLRTCMFTNSPDGHFIIDRHPSCPQVTLAGGFSGHGFKFCSVVGEILADLSLEGGTCHDIALFPLGRFAT